MKIDVSKVPEYLYEYVPNPGETIAKNSKKYLELKPYMRDSRI